MAFYTKRFSIVTPSFRQPQWLRLCAASIADQAGDYEHIIQDAGTDPAELEFLRSNPHVRLFQEKDAGMYDAINRGFAKAKGEFFAYLNCDEQYLPGTLEAAGKWFDAHPDVDMVFGDVIKVNEQGQFLSVRKMQTPLLYHTWTCHLSTLTCGTFFRSTLFEHGFVFNTDYKVGGDGEWMVRLLRAGVRMGTLGQFTSTFTETGANLGSGTAAQRENLALKRTAPAWARLARPLLIVGHRIRRLAGGMYSQGPFQYGIYTLRSCEKREEFSVAGRSV